MKVISICTFVVAVATGLLCTNPAFPLLLAIFVLLLGSIITLSFLKPKLMWAVATMGINAKDGSNLHKSYGPFAARSAAEEFRNKWTNRFEGFAVVEYREVGTKPVVLKENRNAA